MAGFCTGWGRGKEGFTRIEVRVVSAIHGPLWQILKYPNSGPSSTRALAGVVLAICDIRSEIATIRTRDHAYTVCKCRYDRVKSKGMLMCSHDGIKNLLF